MAKVSTRVLNFKKYRETTSELVKQFLDTHMKGKKLVIGNLED
jgi:hypothetical protein